MIRRLVVPDVHFPDHDPVAWSLMLQVAQDFKPHEIIILGDFFDCYAVSRYDKHPLKMYQQLEEEISTGVTALTRLSNLLKPSRIWFLEGNHEARVQKYMQVNAGVLMSAVKSPVELFELPRKTTYVPYGQQGYIEFDGLYATHGTVCGKHPARGMLEKLGKSVVFGHTHRVQYAHKTMLGGHMIQAFNCGWLGSVAEAAEYIQDVADWSHGFATALFTKGGKWAVNLHTIQGQEVIANNKHYTRQRSPDSR